jgi:hypothetical protein
MKIEVHGVATPSAGTDTPDLTDNVRLGLALMQSGFTLASAAETAEVCLTTLSHWRSIDVCGDIPPESQRSRRKMH